MYCLKRIMLAGLFIVPVLYVQSAWAGFLPDSTYYQGSVEGGPGDDVRVDFAVYITRDDGSSEFTDDGFAAPGDGDFTYVYQVFNDVDDDDFSINLFQVFEIDLATIAGADDEISSQDDQEGGIATDGSDHFDLSFTHGIWEFEQGALIKGEQSWLLTISSDFGPTAGDFSINESPFVVPEIPEPTTMILFGVGSFFLMARRKGSVGMSR